MVTVSHCRTSMTMAQTAPLAFPATVPQEEFEEVQRLRARSRERPRRSPSRRTVSQRRPPSPQCPGSWLRSNGASAQSPDPPQGPAKPPVHGRQRPPPGRAGAFGPVHRGLEHGRDRLRRPEQCPASEEPELENRVEPLTGPAPFHQFHPRLPLEYAGPQNLAYVDEGVPVVQLQGVAYASGTHRLPRYRPQWRASSTNPTA